VIAVVVIVFGLVLWALSSWSLLAAPDLWPDGSFARLMVVGNFAEVFVGVVALALALVLTLRLRGHRDARVLALFFAFLGVGVTLSASNPMPGSAITRAIYSGAIGLSVAALMRFSLLFPEPMTAASLQRPGILSLLRRAELPLVRLPVLVWIAGSLLAVSQFAVLGGIGRAQEFTSWGTYPASRVLFLALMATYLVGSAFLVASLVNLHSSYLLGSPESRRKVLWIAQGIVIGAAGFVFVEVIAVLNTVAARTILAGAFPWIITLGKPLALLTMLVTLALAIFFGGAVHESLVVSSAVIYGLLGSTGFVVFAGVENAFSELLEARLNLPGVVGSIAAGAVTAVVVLPLRALLTRLMRRRESEPVAQ